MLLHSRCPHPCTLVSRKKTAEFINRQRKFHEELTSDREQLVNDPSLLHTRITEHHSIGLGVTNARDNYEVGRSLSLLTGIAQDGMRAKLGSGGLASVDEAVVCWKSLFRSPGGVNFAEIGKIASPLMVDVPIWQVMRGPFKVPKKERKQAVKGARLSGKEDLALAGEKEVFAATTAEDIQVCVTMGAGFCCLETPPTVDPLTPTHLAEQCPGGRCIQARCNTRDTSNGSVAP